MSLRETFKKYKQFKIHSLSPIREKASQYSKISLLITILLFLIFVYLIQQIPHLQVAQFGITNPKDLADAENSYRATLAQILGGVAIGIGLYYTWRRITIAEENLKVSQKNLEISKESQITERFTRAVDQLGAIDQFGNPAIEIRLGGIYALEGIANESETELGKPEKYYWPIIEILTAYIKKNSSIKSFENEKITSLSMDIQANETTKREIPNADHVSLDIQSILTVIKRRRFFFNSGEPIGLDLQKTHLRGVELNKIHLEKVSLLKADLKKAELKEAHFEGACLKEANLKEANLSSAHLEGADLMRAHLEGAKDLSLNQLSKVNTLDGTTLDEKFLEPLKEQFPSLFKEVGIILKII